MHAREMLLVMTTQEVCKPVECHFAVLAEHSASLQLLGSCLREQVNSLPARLTERVDGFFWIELFVSARTRKLVGIERNQIRVFFRDETTDADVVTVDLNISDVAGLLGYGKPLARHAFPAFGYPAQPAGGCEPEQRFELLRHERKGLDNWGNGAHCAQSNHRREGSSVVETCCALAAIIAHLLRQGRANAVARAAMRGRMNEPCVAALDDLDIQILRLYQDDTQVPAHVIAERVGLSPAAVQRRLKRMRDTGAIQREIAQVDLSALV
jgi:hypothetical protein